MVRTFPCQLCRAFVHDTLEAEEPIPWRRPPRSDLFLSVHSELIGLFLCILNELDETCIFFYELDERDILDFILGDTVILEILDRIHSCVFRSGAIHSKDIQAWIELKLVGLAKYSYFIHVGHTSRVGPTDDGL